MPRKVSYLISGGRTDTREGWMSYAYDLNLDSESLRCRAVKAMITVDPSLARRLFFEVVAVPVPPHQCSGSLSYNGEIFYETLLLLVKSGFSESERNRNEQFNFVLPFVSSVSSAAQVVPLAKFLRAANVFSKEEVIVLLNTFSQALGRLVPDDRAFRDGYGVIESVDELSTLCLGFGITCDNLVNAVRGHIVRNLSGTRCAEGVHGEVGGGRTAGGKGTVVDRFNEWKARFPQYVSREVEAVSEDEVRVVKVAGAADNPPYWTSAKAKDLLRGAQELRFGPVQRGTVGRPQPLSVEARRTADWETRLVAVLGKMEDWKPGDEKSEVDYFLQKGALYETLVELVPEGAERDLVLRQAVDHIAASRLQGDNPVLWFQQTSMLLQRLRLSRLTEAAVDKRTERDVEWVLKRLEQSGSMILTLYARLERLKGQNRTPQ